MRSGCGLPTRIPTSTFRRPIVSWAAFPALLAEAMMNDAMRRGVPTEIARRAAQQIMVGSGKLKNSTELHLRKPWSLSSTTMERTQRELLKCATAVLQRS